MERLLFYDAGVGMALSLQRYVEYDFRSNLNTILKERIKKEEKRVTKIEIKNRDLLNEGLIIEILSWLPVKDLLRFKTVCKSWFRIISSRHFIDKHLKNYYNHTDSWDRCLLANYTLGLSGVRLVELLLDETHRVLADAEFDDMYQYGLFISGPCDGIYYLSENMFGEHALWNPAINELKRLPPVITQPNLPSNLMNFDVGYFGFGVDPITKDYKLVVIKDHLYVNDEDSTMNYPLSVFIYSLRTDSWRYWGDLARYYHLFNNVCYVCVNGCLYWLGCLELDPAKSPEVIISFDMGAEEYQEIQPPPNYIKPASNCLGIYDDSVAFLSVRGYEKCFDVWTLNEGLWTKKLTIETLLDIQVPLGHWKDNKLLLEGGNRRLLLCDPDAGEVWDLGFERDRDCRGFQGLCVYMESLVSITDRNNWSHETDTDQQQV